MYRIHHLNLSQARTTSGGEITKGTMTPLHYSITTHVLQCIHLPLRFAASGTGQTLNTFEGPPLGEKCFHPTHKNTVVVTTLQRDVDL